MNPHCFFFFHIMEQEQLMIIKDDTFIQELAENVFLDNSNEFNRLNF